MNPAIDFGLLTALLYGVSDFFAKYASRAVGIWRTLFWGELCSVSLLTVWIACGGAGFTDAFSMPPSVWGVAVLSNLTILAATAVFYRALTVGSFSVVAPIVATYGAITAVLSAFLGEPLGLAALGGIGVSVLGAAMASVPAQSGALPGAFPGALPDRELAPRATGKGAGLASVSALLYGVGFCVQAHYVVPKLGNLLPVWLYYALGASLLGGAALLLRKNLAPPALSEVPVVFGTGLAASGAFLALTLAVTGGDVAVPTVLASLASVVTVLLARVLIKEQVALHQWAGIAAVIVGLVMLHDSPQGSPARGQGAPHGAAPSIGDRSSAPG